MVQPALGSPPASSTAAPSTGPDHAFGVGRVIARTFSAWWHHVLAFSLITLVAYLPLILLSLLGGMPVPGVTAPSAASFDPAAAPPTLPQGFWLAYSATMLLFLVEVGAITHGVINYLAGKPVSVGAMIATGVRRLVPLIVVGILCYLLVVVGFVLLVVPGVILGCALAVAIPAVVVERPGVLGAIRRSFALTKGKRFAIFVAFLVFLMVLMGVTMVGGFLLPQLTASFSPMLGTWLGLAVNVAFGTLLWVAPGVVYHDLRVAKDGVSTAQLVAVFE